MIKEIKELVAFWNKINDKKSIENIKELSQVSYIPFIGSGMSVPFGYQNWSEFLSGIINNYIDNHEKQHFEEQLNQFMFLELADNLNTSIGEGIVEEEVRTEFHKNKMRDVEEKENYLSLFKQSSVKTFVTTNFDPVIETHMEISADHIYLPSNLTRFGDVKDALRAREHCVIKLHGTADKKESIILTGQTFNNMYKKTDGNLKGIVDYLWHQSVLLFIGCGLKSDYLIEYMKNLASTTKTNWHYAILPYPEKNESILRKNELAKLKIRPIWYEPKKHKQILTILKFVTGILEIPLDVEDEKKNKSTIEDVHFNSSKDTDLYKKSDDYVKGSTVYLEKSLLDVLMLSESSNINNERFKYVDHLALEVKDNINLQKKLSKAILSQNNDFNKIYSKSNDIVGDLLNKILVEKNKYPLAILGEPGTGKSTLLSLIFLRSINKKTNSFIVDTHYYDKWNIPNAKTDLASYLEYVSNNLSKDLINIIFIDGINRFKRDNKALQDLILTFVRNCKEIPNIKFVLSIGKLDESLFPPFEYVEKENNLIVMEPRETLVLHPVNNSTSALIDLVKLTIEYFELCNKKIKNKKSTQEIDKLCHYCKRIGMLSTDFRTINFILKQQCRYKNKEDFYSIDIGEVFNSYFHSINDERLMQSIAKYTALGLLQEKNRRVEKFYYLYKSEAIRNFFFAYYYISLLTKADVGNLKIFNCIFTPGINRFAVDLMRNQVDHGLRIVKNIAKMMADGVNVSDSQKNQMVFMLGRVNEHNCKKEAINILVNEYRSFNWNVRMTTSSAMYIRSVGISLIYLGVTTFADDFYEKLIYNGFLSRINRNFHIQYFLTNSYRFDKAFKLDDSAICSVENIENLYKQLYHNIFKENANNDSLFVNIITILNLTVYKIFYLEKNEKKDIEQAIELICFIKSKINLSNKIVSKYVNDVATFISNGNVYIGTLTKLYNLKIEKRKGWIKRGISKHINTESIADHTWACCQLALLFLPEHVEDCKFINFSEPGSFEKYNLSKILKMLIVHDLGEVYIGDIITCIKSEEDEKRESDGVRSLVTLDTLPHFNTFGYIDKLASEFRDEKTYDAKIARDIDLIEPLVQLFVYRKYLKTYSNDSGKKERDDWIRDVQEKLNTDLGRNLLDFLENHVLNYFEE